MALYLQGCAHSGDPAGAGFPVTARGDALTDFLHENGPVDRTLGIDVPNSFSGDSFQRAHGALWNLDGFLKKNPPPIRAEADVPVVVVGGGVSGLSTAYLLRDLQPLVLEQ